MNKINVGGQAVIEGVMMRLPKKLAIAVRQPDQSIHIHSESINSFSEKYKFFKYPVFRGVLALFEAISLGIKGLSLSASLSGEEDEQLTKKDMMIAVAGAVFFAILLFVVIPTALGRFTAYLTNNIILLNLIEGLIRITVFLLYVLGISRMKDIYRVFQYHGAEHKVIHCYEKNEELTLENAKKYPTLHRRCGTSFLFIVMFVSILTFTFLGWPNILVRILSRIILLPVVAGISYEIIKYAGRKDNALTRIISAPGLMLQRITTKEPEDEQIEVAISALKGVLN